MKFKFGLEKVLGHRKVKEDIAKKEYQEVVHLVYQEQDKLNLMNEQKTNARSEACKKINEGGSQGQQILQIYEFIKGQDLRIERQTTKVKELEKLVELKQEILRRAAMDVKIMEKLKEKKKNEYIHEMNSREQKEVDELNVLRFDREVILDEDGI